MGQASGAGGEAPTGSWAAGKQVPPPPGPVQASASLVMHRLGLGDQHGVPCVRPRSPAGRPASSMPALCPSPCPCRARPPHGTEGRAPPPRPGQDPLSGACAMARTVTLVCTACAGPASARIVQTVNYATRPLSTGTRRPYSLRAGDGREWPSLAERGRLGKGDCAESRKPRSVRSTARCPGND